MDKGDPDSSSITAEVQWEKLNLRETPVDSAEQKGGPQARRALVLHNNCSFFTGPSYNWTQEKQSLLLFLLFIAA